jgi:lantibiotic modifying enzyme
MLTPNCLRCTPHLSRRELIKGGLAASAAAMLRPESLFALFDDADALAPERPYLEAARRAARWIARSAVRDKSGTAWPWNPAEPESIQLNLYTGTPGVVLFYLELAHATGDEVALSEAVAGADYVAASLADDDQVSDAGLYTGLAGHAYTLELAYRLTQQSDLGDAAAFARALLRTAAQSEGKGVAWSDATDIISGSAGIGLFLLWAHDHVGDAAALEMAAGAGRRLIELGEQERGGLKWLIVPGYQRNYPNFSHGTAGVSYFLATLYEATREAEFLDAAQAGARYLQAAATRTTNDGRMIFHSEPGNEELFYLSWCHGPAGTARLFHRLGRATGDSVYQEYVQRLAQAIVDMRVPGQSPGFWNNVSQCCGNAGVIEFYIALYGVTGDDQHLEYARQVAADALARATEDDGGIKWIQAEHRVRPELLIAQTGLMQGAAGVGLAMLHLDGVLQQRRRLVALPDDPFDE